MSFTRRRIRSRSSRFLGALMGSLLFLLFVAGTGGLGHDPTSNFNLIALALGMMVVGAAGAWFFPWLQNHFSARQIRKKTLYQMHQSTSRSARRSRDSKRGV